MDTIVIQFARIIPFWLSGIALGAYLRTYHSKNVDKLLLKIANMKNQVLPIIIAAVLGAASPITLFGIIPLLYILDIHNNRRLDAILTSFITTSILISPNILIFTVSLGMHIAVLRLFFTILAGIFMGLVVNLLSHEKEPFLLSVFVSGTVKDIPAKERQFLKNFWGAFKKTGKNLLIGIVISVALHMFIPDTFWELTFSNSFLAVPISAVLGVGLYQCGGGSIPIIQVMLNEGLPVGAAMVFMMIGPLTKITNLAALKTILPMKKLLIYSGVLCVYIFIIGFSLG